MFSNVREVRYIDENFKHVFIESVAGFPRVPNIGEIITDRDCDRDWEYLYYKVVDVRTLIDRTAGRIIYDVFLKQI